MTAHHQRFGLFSRRNKYERRKQISDMDRCMIVILSLVSGSTYLVQLETQFQCIYSESFSRGTLRVNVHRA